MIDIHLHPNGSIVKMIGYSDDGTFLHPGPGTMGNYPAWCQAVRLVRAMFQVEIPTTLYLTNECISGGTYYE